MAEHLDVFLHDDHIGVITPTRRDRRQVTFAIEPTYAGAPSMLTEGFSLVPGTKADTRHASNFFGGYAPEGNHRIRLASTARIDESDLFALLKHYGLTMAGALSIRTEKPSDHVSGKCRPLSTREVIRKLEKAQRDFDLGNEPDSGRSMLPGFQPKLLLARFGEDWAYPENLAHSTHILKPSPSHRPAMIFDEYFSHKIARHMGLTGFHSELITYNQTTFLSIERYDRVVEGNKVRPIHQEDAAQALGLDWTDSAAKFQNPQQPRSPSRPTAQRIAELLGSFGDGTDVETWLRHLLYNVIIGNHDAHAKNVSILHKTNEESTIADLYDAVPILHINDDPSRVGSKKIGDELSLAIGGEFNHHRVTLDHFRAEVAGWGGLSGRRADSIIADTLSRFGAALEETPSVPGGSPALRDRLGYNLDRISSGRAIGKPKMPLIAWPKGN
ncbi:type II toxin-antitoxin system HipA family toxin [Arthrobacter ramosus]|uniref:Type II toxin-antitoxin system HipA family toxin n=1 Tax=Arthrobacter ramosus TaxID=1672 RepID=A0ABV5XZS7_ARTRM|nr:HipA domain-containing protein [Arthrobacter ramosus]